MFSETPIFPVLSVKFYTDEGNWDMVGNNTPVFFVRDPLSFLTSSTAQKRHPRTNMRSPAAMWDFWSLSPESLHEVTILFSDRGLPAGLRQQHVQPDQRRRRAPLGQVPLQDMPGHQYLDQRGRRP
jgi:hypothetical protein